MGPAPYMSLGARSRLYSDEEPKFTVVVDDGWSMWQLKIPSSPFWLLEVSVAAVASPLAASVEVEGEVWRRCINSSRWRLAQLPPYRSLGSSCKTVLPALAADLQMWDICVRRCCQCSFRMRRRSCFKFCLIFAVIRLQFLLTLQGWTQSAPSLWPQGRTQRFL